MLPRDSPELGSLGGRSSGRGSGLPGREVCDDMRLPSRDPHAAERADKGHHTGKEKGDREAALLRKPPGSGNGPRAQERGAHLPADHASPLVRGPEGPLTCWRPRRREVVRPG